MGKFLYLLSNTNYTCIGLGSNFIVPSSFSGIILIRCLYYKPGQRLHDYKQVATHALGWVGYSVTAILHILNVFGCPTLYLVLAGQNMNEMLKYTVS